MNNIIETIANRSEISKIIFKVLSDKQRARRATDLTHAFKAATKIDSTIPEREFLSVFKEMQAAKLGSLVIGRRNNHNRFVWKYNLKDVAEAAKGKTVQMKTIDEILPTKKPRRKTKRKVNFTVTPKVAAAVVSAPQRAAKTSTSKGPRIQLNLELSPDVPFKDIQALLELAKSLQSK